MSQCFFKSFDHDPQYVFFYYDPISSICAYLKKSFTDIFFLLCVMCSDILNSLFYFIIFLNDGYNLLNWFMIH